MDEEKVFEKIKHIILIKFLEVVGLEGTHLKLIKPIYEISTANMENN